MEERLYNRELSWLSFNHRVLQEAQNPEVPLYERLKFLAIYSSNLDEFFRVRVAALRSFRALGKSTRKELDEAKIKKTLRTIRQIVEGQQELFGRIFRETLLPELQTHGIFLLNAQSISPGQQLFVEQYFQKEVQAHIQIHWVDAETGELPFLQNRALYFVVQSTDSKHFALVNIPSPPLPRFIELPSPEGRHDILFLDDAIRFNLPNLLGMEIAGAYAVKLSRNADLPIDDEYSGDLLEKIKKGLEKRHVGPPTRLLYDKSMPEPLLERLKTLLDLNKNDLIPGARYHNFNDFFDFPNPSSDASLVYPPMPPLPHPVLEQAKSLLDCMKAGDQMLHYPYHKFDYVIRLIREAADDPQVSFLKITVYRAASRSAVVDALQYALSKGKKVTVFIEAKARFDEEANLQWGEQLVCLRRRRALQLSGHQSPRQNPAHRPAGRRRRQALRLPEHRQLQRKNLAYLRRPRPAQRRSEVGRRSRPRLRPAGAQDHCARLQKPARGPLYPQRQAERPHRQRNRQRQSRSTRLHPPQTQQSGRAGHGRKTLRSRPGRRAHKTHHQGHLLPQTRRARPQRQYRGHQHRRPLPRTRPHLPLRQRRRRAPIHRLRRLDEAQPAPAYRGGYPHLRH
jgi:hypothetical protein